MKFCKLLQVTLFVFSVLSFVMLSSAQASPYFMIGQDEWAQALADGNVRPMTSSDWNGLIAAWHDPNSTVEGGLPPPADFCPAELYVYYPPCCNEPCYPGADFFLPESYVYEVPRCNKLCWIPDFDDNGIVNFVDFSYFASHWLSYSYPTEPGMVMVWYPQIEDYNSASGWKFEYGDDPDLRNTTVSIQVLPTTSLISTNWQFSAGGFIEIVFIDVNNRRRAWTWYVPAGQPLQATSRITLTITTNSAGVSTATPQTTRGFAELGFDISSVKYLFCDEQSIFNDFSRPIPPPSGTLMGYAWQWNYLYNLVITPLPTPEPEPNYFKWRQPARYTGNQGNYWGWDVRSVDNNNIPPIPKEICADDWLCTDDRPVTGIRWWGSFPNRYWRQYPGWRDPNNLSPVPPKGFHIGIWTDSPGDIQDMSKISCPNEMIWEYFCYDYNWKFVGFDRTPDASRYLPTDACYRFSCNLPDPNFFMQDPKVNRVYWLSIAAIYDSPVTAQYVWGWKTRPHYYQDDAVRITSTIGGEWPPGVGSRWGTGSQVEFPRWYSWDLSFELVTNRDVNDP
jgi:hypothetical protein